VKEKCKVICELATKVVSLMKLGEYYNHS